MPKLLVFDIWGDYGHYKKIFATTSAITYPIPFKTAIYGMIGAITGLEKEQNEYLKHFQEGKCKIGIQVLSEPKTQRIHTNFSPEPGPIKSNRKPTLLELLKAPKFRLFVTHADSFLYLKLKSHLQTHTCIYTPSLGLANLLANFEYIGEFDYKETKEGEFNLNGVIPLSQLISINPKLNLERGNEIVEIGMYALEMDENRNVTDRDSVLFDRKQKEIVAKVRKAIELPNYTQSNFYISLF